MSSIVDTLKSAIQRHVDQQNAARQKAAELVANRDRPQGGGTK